MLSSTPPQTLNQDIRLFTLLMGFAILTYLMPWHSPLGRDFVVNATAFGFVSLAIAAFFWQNPITKLSKSVLTWLLLALLIACQPLFNHIAYPDALIFPVISLVVVALTALIGSNIENKANLLNRLFIAVYLMAIATFMIQMMQTQGYQIDYKGWVIARGNANGGRYDGNFGQANHAGYAFVLALCGVIYQLQQSFQEKLNAPQWLIGRYRQYARFGLMVLFVIFTIGLALTQSRAGLVMMLAVIPIFFLTQPIAWKSKLSASVFGLVVFVLYYMGASWISNYSSANQLGAVSRMAGGQGNRSAMSERAMMIFHDHVLTGVGWNNYMGASVDYAQYFKWPEIADHSHNFATMILAELGVLGALCFVPIVWVLVRAIHLRHSSESAIALAFVIASILYASVEYPLWYFRYLAVFALFLALIEQRNWQLAWQSKLTKAMSVVMLGLAMLSGYYIWQYFHLNYLDYNRFIKHTNHLNQDKGIDYQNEVFGFSAYHDRILAMQVPINRHQASVKEAIFEEVLNTDSSQYNILAYAQFLAYKGDQQAALTHIKAACVMVKNLSDCDNVDTDLGNLAKQDPATFAALYREFRQWRDANPEKTGLKP